MIMEKDSIFQKIFDKGLAITLIISLVNFLIGRISDGIWSNCVGLFILAVYILIVLVSMYNSKLNPMFDLSKLELWFYQLIIPCVTVIIIGIICIALENGLQINSIDGFYDLFTNNEKISWLIGIFSCVALITNFMAYENVRLNKKTKDSCLLPNGILETQQRYEEKLEGICRKLEMVEAVLNEKSQVAYTATCIPIKYNKKDNSFVLAMIKNISHKESQWMFPGSHVEVSDNRVKEEFDLTDIDIVPRRIIEDKVKKEAGLFDLQFIDPSYDKVSYENTEYGREKRGNSSTCYLENAPVFNYLFKVNKSARCYTTKNHRCHYDFTYIGEYSNINEEEAGYDVIEIKLKNIKDMQYLDAIAYINANVGRQINNKLNIKKGKRKKNLTIPNDQLFLDSIPEMIYNAILFYVDYMELGEKENSKSDSTSKE